MLACVQSTYRETTSYTLLQRLPRQKRRKQPAKTEITWLLPLKQNKDVTCCDCFLQTKQTNSLKLICFELVGLKKIVLVVNKP